MELSIILYSESLEDLLFVLQIAHDVLGNTCVFPLKEHDPFLRKQEKKLVRHQMFLAKQFDEINVNESETCELYFT